MLAQQLAQCLSIVSRGALRSPRCANTGIASAAIGASIERGYSSKTQLKRQRGHPRVWPEPGQSAEVPPLQWEASPISLMPSGWAPPTGKVPEGLPFRFTRSRTGGLPVYTDFHNARTRVVTIVRRYTGDEYALADELRRVLGGSHVEICAGRLEVEGNHVAQLKTWMAGLGF